MSARDELVDRLAHRARHDSTCTCGVTSLSDAWAIESALTELLANPAPFLDLLLRADPAGELDTAVPPKVLDAAREAVPGQGKGSTWWLPAATRDAIVEAVATAVWAQACDLLLGPPLTPAMVEAVRLTEAGELETFPAAQEPGAACFCRGCR